jgi:hypothetical protein
VDDLAADKKRAMDAMNTHGSVGHSGG